MMELSHAGKLNVFWFVVSLFTAALTLLEGVGFTPLQNLPSINSSFWYYLLVTFVFINVLLRIFYTEFMYATTVRSCLLGHVFAAGVYTLVVKEPPWNIVGWYLCVLSVFHFSEFLSIAWCNTGSLSVSSFILNHSREYWIALAASWLEFVVEAYWLPGVKTLSVISWIGLGLCVFGEFLRKTAMFTAATNFNHLVQLEKDEKHQLVTHGIYSWSRHPSYVGWFLWSIATQLLLLNPVCAIAYTVVSWNFFRERIIMEEWYLLNFFQDEYRAYQQKVGTGIPFIEGYVVHSYEKTHTK